ncbi:MAG: hypothetical protein R2874_07920 [Desulfobacterales bacterium]
MAADQFGKKESFLLGFVLFAILYCGFAMVSGTRCVWILFGLYGLFMGLTEGIKAFLATIIPVDFKATAFGVYHSVVNYHAAGQSDRRIPLGQCVAIDVLFQVGYRRDFGTCCLSFWPWP